MAEPAHVLHVTIEVGEKGLQLLGRRGRLRVDRNGDSRVGHRPYWLVAALTVRFEVMTNPILIRPILILLALLAGFVMALAIGSYQMMPVCMALAVVAVLRFKPAH